MASLIFKQNPLHAVNIKITDISLLLQYLDEFVKTGL